VGAGGRRVGNGVVSGLNWPLKFRSEVMLDYSVLRLCESVLLDVKNKLSTGILIQISNR